MSAVKKAASATAIVAAIAAFIAPSEGLRTKTYLDPVGIPTVCYGETKGVKIDDSYTPAQCMAMLKQSIPEYLRVVDSLGNLTDGERVAYTDFTYNVGVGNFRRSSIVKYVNAKERVKACNVLLLYNKAKVKGKYVVLPGLDERAKKRNLKCLSQLVVH